MVEALMGSLNLRDCCNGATKLGCWGLHLGEFLPGFQLQGAAELNNCPGGSGCGLHFCWSWLHVMTMTSTWLKTTGYFDFIVQYFSCMCDDVRRVSWGCDMSSSLVLCYDNFQFLTHLHMEPVSTGSGGGRQWRSFCKSCSTRIPRRSQLLGFEYGTWTYLSCRAICRVATQPYPEPTMSNNLCYSLLLSNVFEHHLL